MPAPRSYGGRGDGSLVARLNATVQLHPANNLMRLDKYFRSAELLQRQAAQYRRQANEEQLYVMLLRLVSLVVETIPQHKAFDRSDGTYQALRKQCLVHVMPELERLKLSLDLKDRTSRLLAEEPWAPAKKPGTVRLAAGPVPEVEWLPSTTPLARSPSQQQQPFGADNGEHALLPGAASSAAPSAAPSTALALPAASAAALSRHAILPSWAAPSAEAGRAASAAPLPDAVRAPLYPSVVAQLASELGEGASLREGGLAPSDARPSAPPVDPWQDAALRLGPQELPVTTVAPPVRPPEPGDTCCSGPVPSTQVVPSPDAAGAAAARGVAEYTRRQSIRDIHVSVALMNEFLQYAVRNTQRGIESCGILAGTLSVDEAVFTINTLIIPKQEGTSDTVQALGEEEVFEVQDSRGLYPLGWIHTHPTQTCFLSSVDVHTQCGYQTMLDEAVAIVMAPRDTSKKVGIFRLSTPGGLKTVQGCDLRGFHTHPPTATGQPLYEYCKHVYLNPRVKFDVVDLR